ncbi:MAG: PH domain-containing protein [Pirellulaceae bacterium]|nr:PH domain-containing protein [Pirellulaceae bacterium]
MTVWPSIAVYPSGQWLGRMYDLRWPGGHVVRLGHLVALLSIPWALVLYLLRVAPRTGIRYTVTNRRILIQRGLPAIASSAIALGDFDAIDLVVESGQAWFPAGDLVFRQQGREVFRLRAVSRPESFRQVCLKTREARVAVDRVCPTSAAAG